MSWATIRDGVKTRLDTISGLSARDTIPDSLPDKDTATVMPSPAVLSPTGHATKTAVSLFVLIRCVRGRLRDSQDALDAYIWPTGTNSIIAAVYADRTLSGTVDDIRWTGTDSYTPVEGTTGVQANVNFIAFVSA